VIEFVIKQQMGDSRIYNVLHAGKGGGLDSIPVIDYAASMLAAWKNRIMPAINPAVKLIEVTARDLSSQEGDAVVLPATNVQGGDPGNVEPAQLTLVAKKITALGGRSRRGRLYLSGLPELAVDGILGNVNSDYLANTQVKFDGFLADIQAIGGTSNTQAFVVSRYKGVDAQKRPIPRAVGIKTPITRFLCVPALGTQRGRNKR
jgi:hypothetical protein